MQSLTKRMTSLRLKVTDRCPWNCWWCHNEGTGVRNIALTKDVPWDTDTEAYLDALRTELGIAEIHLTGGEPTSHPLILDFVSGLKRAGYTIKMTSIGGGENKTRQLIERGVTGFNFSIHSLDPALLTETQVDRTESTMTALLARQIDSVRAAVREGATAKANLVIAGTEDLERALTVYNWTRKEGVELRLLNELSFAQESEEVVIGFLKSLGAQLVRTVRTSGVSGVSEEYLTKDGVKVVFKKIEDVFLTEMCDGCALKDTVCHERFYAIRLEYRVHGTEPEFLVRLCLHRQDPGAVMPIGDFLNSSLLTSVKHQLAYE